jgi:hypothetical protein
MSRERLRLLDQSKLTQANESEQLQTSESESMPAPALNARQSAILNMQRTQGNAVVRRAVSGQYGAEGGPIEDKISQQINSARGGGQSLDTGVAQRMGESMGSDFSGVRVHNDSHADQLNQTLNARAFTTGSDIFFSKGAYEPGSSSGQKLLAHELTHVVQQGGSTGSGPLTLGPAGDTYEQEADRTSDSVMQRQMMDSSAIQRAPEEDEMVQPMRIQREESAEMEEEEMN